MESSEPFMACFLDSFEVRIKPQSFAASSIEDSSLSPTLLLDAFRCVSFFALPPMRSVLQKNESRERLTQPSPALVLLRIPLPKFRLRRQNPLTVQSILRSVPDVPGSGAKFWAPK